MSVLVIDNGAYELKIGYATDDKNPAHFRVSNSITRSKDRRTYVGNEIENCRDYAGLTYRRPHERGQLVNWETQKAIWDNQFYGKTSKLVGMNGGKPVDPSETSLILTEMPYSLPALSSNMDQIVFEEYGFDSYYRCTPGSLVPWNDIRELYNDTSSRSSPVSECALVIDSGFSSTHVLPVVLGEVYWPAAKRINIGGKHLTNYLKETVSFRYYNMMEETFLMNVIKERVCFVSLKYQLDLEEAHINKRKSLLRIDYALPDYRTSKLGHIVKGATSSNDSNQVLTLTNERFTIPEALFRPSDLNLDQAGIPETAINCVKLMPEEIQSMLLSNVVLVGGNAVLPGYKERIREELQSFSPQGVNLRVGMPVDPISYAWQGGCRLGSQKDMLSKAYVTKADYMEHGVNLCLSRFGIKKMDNSIAMD
ncbi:Arp6p [Sugiyamaella lignohabitans]|uniref:Actin-like protein ARP6 n=1 Tax=Sugiyamaella lignohabitans TaxID=796027 RepID=A0A167ERS4_9ASCO|nr:Arp6p [Sugiyamaella lignohabitans]ANB14395.1 Arp6p [Sugiyamaella lignohabitans]